MPLEKRYNYDVFITGVFSLDRVSYIWPYKEHTELCKHIIKPSLPCKQHTEHVCFIWIVSFYIARYGGLCVASYHPANARSGGPAPYKAIYKIRGPD